MPVYNYQCIYCQVTESRIGGVDDHLAICANCWGLMVRLDHDLFSPYFEAAAVPANPTGLRSQRLGAKGKTTGNA